jgi:uncharacterized protein
MSTHGNRGTRTWIACWVLWAAIMFLSCAAAAPMGMVTASTRGSYFKFGNDIKEMAEREGLIVEVKASNGSFDNIQRMMSRENAAFGIVQSDVLGYLDRNPQYGRAVTDRLRVIFPFYLEQVHILAGPGIQTLADLDGKRVSVGPPKSGTQLTAQNFADIMRIGFGQTLNLSTEDAADGLLEGRLDALFFVAGAPFSAFDRLKEMWKSGNPSERAAVARLHFLPVSQAAYPQLFTEYEPSSIRAKTYDWVGVAIPVAAVRATLIGFDFSSRKNAYFNNRCDQFGALGKAIRNNLAELQAKPGHFHPKWSEVKADRSTRVPGWQYDGCSQP